MKLHDQPRIVAFRRFIADRMASALSTGYVVAVSCEAYDYRITVSDGERETYFTLNVFEASCDRDYLGPYLDQFADEVLKVLQK